MGVRVGVVICCFNGEATIGRCLESLLSQTPLPDRVLVVNDGSTDGTAGVLSGFAADARCHVEVLTQANCGVGAARNAGARALSSDCDVIAYVDDDCVVPPGWCARLRQVWDDADDSVLMIAGAISAVNVLTSQQRFQQDVAPHQPLELDLYDASFFRRVVHYFHTASGRHVALPSRFVFSPVGANMSLRSSAFAASDGFAEGFPSGEEESMARQLIERFGPLSVWMDTGLVVGHEFAPDWSTMWARTRSYGVSAGRIAIQQRRLPALRLTPLLVVASFAVLAPFSRRTAAALAAAVPFLVHSPWVPRAVKRRRLEMAGYPLVLVAMESITNISIARGMWRAWRAS